jgi:hypothetical protein
LTLVVLAGCLPVRRPSVHLEPGASLASYRAFEVTPVKDESGWSFPLDYEIADSLRSRVAGRLRELGYTVVSSRDTATAGVLRIDSRLTAFRSGGMGLMLEGPRTRCRFTSTLLDRATLRRIGEIYAEADDELPPFMVLMSCARMVADEIDRRVRGR